MRASYLRPSSRSLRRYQDSRPWGFVSDGDCTESCVGRIGPRLDSECRCRSSKLVWASGKVTALGPRNMVFSTLPFTVQACDTMQRSAAITRMFGGQHKAREMKLDQSNCLLSRGPQQFHWAAQSFIRVCAVVLMGLLWFVTRFSKEGPLWARTHLRYQLAPSVR